MAIPKGKFLSDLRVQAQYNRAAAHGCFKPLDPGALTWRPKPRTWNILQCFDHLNATHDYYQPRIAEAMANPVAPAHTEDQYAPSLWGRIYMFFALKPWLSFPTAAVIAPAPILGPEVLDRFIANCGALASLLKEATTLDVSAMRVRIDKGVAFNLGDCLKVLVHHDGLHINQAKRVLAAWQADQDACVE